MTELRQNKPAELRRLRPCKLCQEKVSQLDYKDSARLKRFLTEDGKILSRRLTGNCAEHQRELTLAVKRSREIGLCC